MTTLAIAMTTEPDPLPGGCVGVRAGGVLSRVHRTCTAHRADAHCVGRDQGGLGLVYWCPEGHHHLTSDRSEGQHLAVA